MLIGFAARFRPPDMLFTARSIAMDLKENFSTHRFLSLYIYIYHVGRLL
jgi:hypothetical protein